MSSSSSSSSSEPVIMIDDEENFDLTLPAFMTTKDKIYAKIGEPIDPESELAFIEKHMKHDKRYIKEAQTVMRGLNSIHPVAFDQPASMNATRAFFHCLHTQTRARRFLANFIEQGFPIDIRCPEEIANDKWVYDGIVSDARIRPTETAFVFLVRCDRYNEAEGFLLAGANVNAVVRYGPRKDYDAMYYALRNEKFDFARLLIEYGGNIEYYMINYGTYAAQFPFHCDFFRERAARRTAFLVENGAFDGFDPRSKELHLVYNNSISQVVATEDGIYRLTNSSQEEKGLFEVVRGRAIQTAMIGMLQTGSAIIAEQDNEELRAPYEPNPLTVLDLTHHLGELRIWRRIAEFI